MALGLLKGPLTGEWRPQGWFYGLAGRRSNESVKGHFRVLTQPSSCGRLEAVDNANKGAVLSKVTRKFSLQWMKDEDLPWSDMVVFKESEDVGRRWMNVVTVVFKAPDDGLYYEFYYDEGKTEYQDNDWYECLDDEVECIRVEERPVTVTKWLPVEDNS